MGEPSIAAQVVALTKLSVPELRERWREVFGEETTQRHRQYMVKRLAWKLQSDAYGGLSDEAQARLHELQEEFRTSPPETWFRGAKHNRAAASPTPSMGQDVKTHPAPALTARGLAASVRRCVTHRPGQEPFRMSESWRSIPLTPGVPARSFSVVAREQPFHQGLVGPSLHSVLQGGIA